MAIRIRLFASLAEKIGSKELEIEATQGMTLIDAWDVVSDGMPMPGELLMAVNMDYSDSETIVYDGDEVAFFPPISGGSR
jgi:molybdopterin synthase sulfur carrier subunit